MNFNNTHTLITFKSIVSEVKKPSPKTEIPGMLIGFEQTVALYHTQSPDHHLKLSQSMSMHSPVKVTVNNITGEIIDVEFSL